MRILGRITLELPIRRIDHCESPNRRIAAKPRAQCPFTVAEYFSHTRVALHEPLPAPGGAFWATGRLTTGRAALSGNPRRRARLLRRGRQHASPSLHSCAPRRRQPRGVRAYVRRRPAAARDDVAVVSTSEVKVRFAPGAVTSGLRLRPIPRAARESSWRGLA